MSELNESKQFVPLRIAVLTVSDTRMYEDDRSGATLAERIVSAGHAVADRAIVPDDPWKLARNSTKPTRITKCLERKGTIP